MEIEQTTNEDRKIQMTTRLDTDTFEWYQQWAEREDRSMSQVLRIALERYRESLNQAQ